MASSTNDSTAWQVRFDITGPQKTLLPGRPKTQLYVMFLLFMTSLCRVASAEDKTNIFDTLSNEELATLNQLATADRLYAINCLSSKNRMSRRNGGRYGWDNLRKEEHFLVVNAPKDQLVDAGCIYVDQVVSDNEFLGAGGRVWVEGIPTGSFADGDLLNVHGMQFICIGSKTFSTAIGGSRTVMHIVRVNPDNTLETLSPIAEARGMRVWGEGTGSLVLAEFVRADSKELVIRLWDGKRKTISMKAIGESDIEWIESEKEK